MHIWSLTSKHCRTSARTAAADSPHLHPRRLFVTLNDAVTLIVFNSEWSEWAHAFFAKHQGCQGKKVSARFVYSCLIEGEMLNIFADALLWRQIFVWEHSPQQQWCHALGGMRGFLLSSLCCIIRYKPFRRLSSNEAGLIKSNRILTAD